ncbi:hypothetical protein [Methylobacterium dankookense]|uniref:Uncharacterized protein n=1 Tax=Methylobacterium dankookense TaxID=560405 RepID=A0A564G630_9HYPH|nr:hypothetical protein [Methylobacterium dankookense]GJD59291.1 hypothetical protein IFDJLNFL_5219 [Methylobacterium dankookense]VUF16015.1 hypothetical protein MTDSW087_05764 [Methylobacterium dankookense]
MRKIAALLTLPALALASPAGALDIRSSAVAGRGSPAGNPLCADPKNIEFNRADRTLTICDPSNNPTVTTLLNALPAGRKAVEQGRAEDLTVTTGGVTEVLSSLQSRSALYPTRSAAAAIPIPSTTTSVVLGGYAAQGDGGAARYVAVGSQPSHLGRFQSLDGRWWAIAEPVLTPEMFGGKADGGVTDNLAPINAAMGVLGYGNGTLPGVGGKIALHGNGSTCYGISGSIDMTGKHGLEFVGDGSLRSCVQSMGAGTYQLFKVSATVTAPTTKVAVRGLALYCAGMNVYQADGVDWSYTDTSAITDNLFLGCNRGIVAVGSWQLRVERNRWDGLGTQQNGTCLWQDLPTDPNDTFGNNAVIATGNICQNVALYGLRAKHGTGSIYSNNQWLNGVRGVYACDSGSSTWPCQFMFWNGDQTDTTTGEGWYFKKGPAPFMSFMGVAGTSWTGHSYGSAAYVEGASYVTMHFGNLVTTDIGLNLVSTTNSKFTGTVRDYNRNNNGSPGVKLVGSSDNTIDFKATTQFSAVGYNGYVEDATSLRNSIYGFGQSACSIGLQFGGAAAGLAYVGGGQACSYEVNGRTVRMQYYLGLSAKGTSTGVATLAGLPFASAGGAVAYGGMSPFIAASGVSGITSPYAQVGPGATLAQLAQQGATGAGNLSDANFSNTSVITGSLTYTKQ